MISTGKIIFYDTRDIFREIKKTSLRGLGVTEKEFLKVIRYINTEIANELLKGNMVKLPMSSGSLVPLQMDTIVKKNDRIIFRMPIDWKKTKEYGMLVKHDTDRRFKIVYDKRGARYKNCKFVKFTPMRSLWERFIQEAENNNIKCFKS